LIKYKAIATFKEITTHQVKNITIKNSKN